MINGRNRPICSVRSAPNAEPAPPSCCRPATAKPCSSISTRSRPKSSPGRTPLYCLIRPAGMALKPWWFPTTSRSCRCPRAHPSSTVRKTSGSSCVRIGCPTGFSNPSTISSTTAATLGTHSSTNPGKSCPSRDAIGQQSVTQSEDWYYSGKDYPGTADIYASVNLGDLKQLKASGFMETYAIYMHNELQIMVAKGNPKKIAGIDDLARADVRTTMPNP